MNDDDEESKRPWPSWLTWDVVWERAQDSIPWALAVLIALNEVFIEAKPRPEVIPVIGTLIALPFARRQDKRGSDNGK